MPDVFISYKSEQHSWAARLAADLGRYGYSVYLDHDTAAGLVAGQSWRDQLTSKIQQADHFLVLWSSLIGQGSYVTQEIDDRRRSSRAVTLVRLDDSPAPAYLDPSPHQFREFVDLYTGRSAEDVEFFDWNRAVRHLVQQILSDAGTEPIIEIPVVVVAMTQAQAMEIAAGERVVGEVKEGAFAQLMSLLDSTTPFDPSRYGDRPEDWRPFDPAVEQMDWTVERILYDFDRARRNWHRQHRIDFVDPPLPHVFLPYGEALRSPDLKLRAREQLRNSPALVVFDPVSLVHQDVHREVLENGLHTLERAFVIGLGPRISSALPPVQTYFSDVERALFDGLFMADPLDRSRALFGPTLSTCVLNVDHGAELSRWIQLASESILTWVSKSRSRMQPAYSPHLHRGPTSLPAMVSPR